MAINKQDHGGWAVYDGFEGHIAASAEELPREAERILQDFTIDTVRNSTYHPNGFLVNKYRSDETGQLRLHIWPTTREFDLLPHTHPWHMASLVMAGTYIEFLPAVELELGRQTDHELMVPSYNSAHEQVGVESTGQSVSFIYGRNYSYDTGEFHFLPAGAFHSTLMPDKEPILTLVRTGLQLYNNPSFVRDARDQSVSGSLEADRARPSEDEIHAIWEQLQSILP